MGITFEFTSPNSPQFNGRVERKQATLYSKLRANLNGAELSIGLRRLLWAEATNCTTAQEDLIATVTEEGTMCPFEAFEGRKPSHLPFMRQFGEIGIVSKGSTVKIKGKLTNRGRPCLYLGPALNKPKDTHRFMDLKTRKIFSSRDVVWLDKVYGTYQGLSEDKKPSFMMSMIMIQMTPVPIPVTAAAAAAVEMRMIRVCQNYWTQVWNTQKLWTQKRWTEEMMPLSLKPNRSQRLL